MPKSASYSRPGVEAAVYLANELIHHPSIWETISKRYGEMLECKKNGSKLKSLDEECNKLAQTWRITSQEGEEAPYITAESLKTVVDWKFLKGKPRHALWKHLNANTEEDLKSSSQRAFSFVCPLSPSQSLGNKKKETISKASSVSSDDMSTKVKGAVGEFVKLKGIGPATASAFLSLYRPDLFVFMDDEIIECLHEGKRNYTLKIYLEINSKCSDIASQLGEGWTPRKVGQTLWTATQLYASGEEDILALDGAETNNNNSCEEEKKDDNGKEKKMKRRSSRKRKREGIDGKV